MNQIIRGVSLGVVLWASQARADSANVRIINGPTDRVTAVAYSPDGKTLASGGADRDVRLFNPATGGLLHTIETTGVIRAVAWTKDGQAIVAAPDGLPLQAWTLAGQPKWSAKLGTAKVVSLALFADGSAFVAAMSDGSLRWFDAATGKPGRTIKVAKGALVGVALSHDGLFVATSDGTSVRVFDGKTGKPGRTIPADVHQIVSGLAISPDGRVLSVATRDGEVKFSSLLDGKSLGGFTATDRSPIRSISYAATGNRILTSAIDGEARYWDIENGLRVAEYVGHGAPVSTAAVSPDGKEIATGGDDDTVRTWNADTGRIKMKFSGPGGVVTGVVYVPGKQGVASASADGVVRLWDLATGLGRWQTYGHKGVITGMTTSSDGRYVITAGGMEEADPSDAAISLKQGDAPAPPRGDIKIWNSNDGGIVRKLAGHGDQVGALALSGDGRLLVTAAGTDLLVWDMKTASGRFRLPGHTGPIRSVSASADGSIVASGSDDGTARLWNAATSAPIRVIQIGSPVSVLALSPDGTLLATANVGSSGEGVVKLWDTATGNVVRTLKGPSVPVASLTFSPDGWYLASSSRAKGVGTKGAIPGEARVWIVQTGDVVNTLTATSESMIGIESIAFAPDVHSVALGCTDRTVRIWTVK